MNVEENHVITLSYELREDGPGGALIERMDPNYPFRFLFGTGDLLPDFEAALQGLSEGDTFAFTLPPERAYGQPQSDQILALPRHLFQHQGEEPPGLVETGNTIHVTDDQGTAQTGTILAFNEGEVTVDFNHSMAGKTLHFSGVVLHIRPATVEELIRRHYIPEDGTRRPER